MCIQLRPMSSAQPCWVGLSPNDGRHHQPKIPLLECSCFIYFSLLAQQKIRKSTLRLVIILSDTDHQHFGKHTTCWVLFNNSRYGLNNCKVCQRGIFCNFFCNKKIIFFLFSPDFAVEGETSTEKEEISIVPVRQNPDSKTCPICFEDFEEFYFEDANPEKDDEGLWYFRNAVVNDGVNYHRQCLQDKKLNESLDQSAMVEDDPSQLQQQPQEGEEEKVKPENSNKMGTTENVLVEKKLG